MVSYNINTDAKNNGFPQSSPDALHLWKRFKKLKKQEPAASSLDKDEENEKLVKEIRQTSKSDNKSSVSCRGIFKKGVAQEKFFRLQCQNQYNKTAQNSSFSTDSSSGSDRERAYLTPDDCSDANHEPCVNMTGVLHLRKPLSTNPDNDKIYYEDRGRMPPIDWKNLTGSSWERKPEKMQKLKTQMPTIKTVAKSKLQISNEFSNFVDNSVSHKTAYNKQGNIERNINAIDSPILKIQQRISKKTLDTIQIPASVKSSFIKSSSDSHLLNRIDTFRAIDPMTFRNFTSAKVGRQDEMCNYKHDGNLACNDPEQYKKPLHENKLPAFEVSSDKQTQDHRPTHVCDDYDRISYIDTLTDEENAAKRESRKKEMSYEDDLFTFVQNPINSNLSVPSAKKKSTYSFPFNRIKAVCREKLYKTVDSDDSLNVGSDLGNLSVCTVSLRASLEGLERKMKKINNHASEKECILPDDGRVLENKSKLLNRCIRASHDYLKVAENNVVEITQVKVGLKPEPLIKPISTRYFAKTSADGVELNDISSNKHVSISTSQKKEESFLHFDSRRNENINSSSSTVLTENEFHQKNKQIDSGFCIKSTDNSSSIHDSSENRLELEADYEKNCNALEVTEKFRKSEMKKIEAISYDSKNHEMECDDFIDYDAFDVENIELFFPALAVGNLKKTVSSRMIGEMSAETKDLSSSKSLESDFEISKNNYSSTTASISSNLNSDSENPSSSNSQVNVTSKIFKNVDIEFSTLRTDGLDYGEEQEIGCNNTASFLKNQNVHLALNHTSEISNTSKQSCNWKNAIIEESKENFINNNVASLHNEKESKSSNENVAVAPKSVSKKMQKYRTTLENYKNKKCKSEADTKQEDKNAERHANASPIETCKQKPLQRPILQEIQKHMHLTFKPIV